MDSQWRTLPCFYCQNVGNLWSSKVDYCEICESNGILWIRPQGQLFGYPGGPAVGSIADEWYTKATPMMPFDWHILNEQDNDFDNFLLTEEGLWSIDNIVHCSCGWEGNYIDHALHVESEEKLFVEGKLRPN